MSENRKRSGEKWTIFQTVHIVVGIVIIVMSIIAFINPNDNRLVFPTIFALAAFLSFMRFMNHMRLYSAEKKQVIYGLIDGFIALFLTVLVIIAVITL